MVTGGIGITPAMGILKDIYEVGLSKAQTNVPESPSAIENIYMLWVVPSLEDYTCFEEELGICLRKSHYPGKPNLKLMVYITRSKEKLDPPLVAGRPDIASIYRIMMESGHRNEDAGLVFACGPQALVSETWDKSIQYTLKGRLIDFHHEIFDF